MSVVLYSTHCPKCEVLEKKLKEKGITYTQCNDVDAMLANGLNDVPWLEVDGEMMNFGNAVKWINGKEG